MSTLLFRPCRAFRFHQLRDPGRRFALPRADLFLPLQGDGVPHLVSPAAQHLKTPVFARFIRPGLRREGYLLDKTSEIHCPGPRLGCSELPKSSCRRRLRNQPVLLGIVFEKDRPTSGVRRPTDFIRVFPQASVGAGFIAMDLWPTPSLSTSILPAFPRRMLHRIQQLLRPRMPKETHG